MRRLLMLALLAGCASVPPDYSAMVPRAPQDLLTRARTELGRMGYTITEMPMDSVSEPGKEPIGGSVRGERFAGRDLDTAGFVFEVITVSAAPAAGQTRLMVHGGMELAMPNGFGRSPTPSTSAVRKEAAALLKRLQ